MFDKEVAVLFADKYHYRGKFIESFDPQKHTLPVGVYFFKLSFDDIVVQRKMIFVR